MQAQTKFLLFSVKLIEHFLSTLNVEQSDLSVGPPPRIKISFFLLSRCTDELSFIIFEEDCKYYPQVYLD